MYLLCNISSKHPISISVSLLLHLVCNIFHRNHTHSRACFSKFSAPMADEVMLLDFWASPFGMRVRIALAMKGIKHEYREEDLFNKGAFLLQMNPVHKKIPVLIHKGRPVCESLIVLQYIDEVWSEECPLLPSDPYLRSQARFWGDFVDKKVYELGRKIWATKGEEQAAGAKQFVEGLKLLEGELGDKPFFGGESPGYVDVALAPFYTWFLSYEVFGGFKTEVESPKLSSYFRRCLGVEAIAKSLPDREKVHEFIIGLRKRYGVE